MRKTTVQATALGIALLATSCNDCPKYPVLNKETVKPDPLEQLVNELKVISIETTVWRLEFNSKLGNTYQFTFLYKEQDDPVLHNRMAAPKSVSVGDTFFEDGIGKERFKLADIISQEENTSTGQREVLRATVEDLSEHRKGEKYELPFRHKQRDLIKTT